MVVWALSPSEHGVLKTVAQIKKEAKMQVSHEHGERTITLDGIPDDRLKTMKIRIMYVEDDASGNVDKAVYLDKVVIPKIARLLASKEVVSHDEEQFTDIDEFSARFTDVLIELAALVIARNEADESLEDAAGIAVLFAEMIMVMKD